VTMKRTGKSSVGSSADAAVLKREIIGIVLMFSSLFFISAILRFHPEDEVLLSTLPWYDIFSKAAKDAADAIHNPFGLFGARLAAFFVVSFIGYFVVLPISSIFFLGWSLFRANSLKSGILFFLFSIFFSLDIATLFGLTTMPFSDLFAGAVGRMLAERLSTVIGVTGAAVLLLVIAVVLMIYVGKGLLFTALGGATGFKNSLSKPLAMVTEKLEAFRKKKNLKKEQREREKELRNQERIKRDQELLAKTVVKPAPKVVVPPTQQDEQVRDEPFRPAPVIPEAFLVESPSATSLPSMRGEPEMVIHTGIREKEADLDERKLKVQTKDREAYRFPSIDLLDRVPEEDDRIDEQHLADSKRKLLEKLRIYKIEVKRISTTVGPRVTLFELELEPDVKVSRITSLENDLAMALAARGIRIIAPIPGKNAVGVEIPNSKPKTVWLRSVLQVEKFKNSTMMLPIVLGKTIANEVCIADLASMPHLLIAGATGAGKSVCINVIISSLLYACSPDKVKFVMIDPKRVELFQYQHLKNHFLMRFPGIEEQIITDPQKAVYALRCVVKEMELRYETLEKVGVRNIGDHNRRLPEEAMPYLVVVIDELADLMITAGRDVEEPIIRIAQLARAVGIHLIVATQRPSVDVITGIIKANFPARIAFQVASRVDSRTILDGSGAEQLLGNGDMLYQPSNQPKSLRIQCPYVSSSEVEQITAFIGSQHSLKTIYMLPAADAPKSSNGSSSSSMNQERDGRDAMFEEAARLVVMHQQASVSLLQRRLRLGFSRAGRVMDQLHANGIVGMADGSKARDVLIKNEDSLELLLRNLD